jgi:hypothetical protein
MTDEPDKAGKLKKGAAWVFGLLLVGCSATQPPELKLEDVTGYRQAEEQVRKERRGLWAGAWPVPPWDFRLGKTAKAPGEKPLLLAPVISPLVAGNRSSRVYHLPNCADYSKVPERNRLLFKTKAEAQAAGYRKA